MYYIIFFLQSTGTYYNYDSSGKSYHDSVMADQCAGHWFLRASNMVPEGQEVFPPDHVKSALKTVHKMNVMAFKDGHFGAVNGVRPSGKVDTTSLQGEEVWTGVTYGVAANMIQEVRFASSQLVHHVNQI